MRSSVTKTPNRSTRVSAVKCRDSVKRNLNSSFSSPKKLSPKSPKKPRTLVNENVPDLNNFTLIINRKTQTCRYKRFYYESYSESESDEDPSKLILTGKRQIKSPVKYGSDFLRSPSKAKRTSPYKRDFTPLKKRFAELNLASRSPATPKSREMYFASRSPEAPKGSERNRPSTLPATPRSREMNLKAKSPKTSKTTPKKTPEATPKKTPKSRISFVANATPKTTPLRKLKLIREGVITPSVQSRDRVLKLPGTPLIEARNHLHVSYVPKELPCREKEYEDVFSFLEGKLLDKSGGCMYISGVPGTGKTATVTAVINKLQMFADKGEVENFDFVSINGMKLTEPRQAYVEIYRQLSGKTVPWEQACNILEEKFTKKSKKQQTPIILLVDELDIVCTKRQDVVYNLLDWPSKANTQLIVITIANTMDLPERLLMNRVTSRLGLTRLTFQAYTYKQLQEIVTNRMMGAGTFNPDAVQLVARKVASVSGDARRALDICRRSAEIAELEGADTPVTMHHVNEALRAMVTQPKVRAIRNCSKLEQYVLQAVLSEVERTGIEETVFSDVYKMLVSLSALNGFTIVSSTVALGAVSRLSACRLLLVDQKSSDLDQKIVLNVSPDDVYFALKEE